MAAVSLQVQDSSGPKCPSIVEKDQKGTAVVYTKAEKKVDMFLTLLGFDGRSL